MDFRERIESFEQKSNKNFLVTSAHIQFYLHSQNRKTLKPLFHLASSPINQPSKHFISYRDCSNTRTISVVPLSSPFKHKQKNRTVQLDRVGVVSATFNTKEGSSSFFGGSLRPSQYLEKYSDSKHKVQFQGKSSWLRFSIHHLWFICEDRM